MSDLHDLQDITSKLKQKPIRIESKATNIKIEGLIGLSSKIALRYYFCSNLQPLTRRIHARAIYGIKGEEKESQDLIGCLHHWMDGGDKYSI